MKRPVLSQGICLVVLGILLLSAQPNLHAAIQDTTQAGNTSTPETGPASSILFSVTIPSRIFPDGEAFLTAQRSTWAPGSTGSSSIEDWGTFGGHESTAGFYLDHVLEGTITMHVDDGPLLIQRASGGASDAGIEIAAGTEVELTQGDVAIRALEHSWNGRNDSAQDAVLVSAVVISIFTGFATILESYDGVAFEHLGQVGIDDWALVPDGPLAVTLQRHEIAAGTMLTPYPVSPAAPEILIVEHGVMVVRDALPDGSDLGSVIVERGAVVPLPYPDQRARSIAAAETLPGGTDPTDEKESLVYLSLTFTPADEEPQVPSADTSTVPATETSPPGSDGRMATEAPISTAEGGDTPDGAPAHAGSVDIEITFVGYSSMPIGERTPSDEFVIVRVTLTPTGSSPTQWSYDWFALTDSDARLYLVDSAASDTVVRADPDALSDTMQTLVPGMTYEVVLVFDVPLDATGLVLVPNPDGGQVPDGGSFEVPLE